MSRALIVLADEPGLLLADAAAKRRLWTALRSVRRALVGTGAEPWLPYPRRRSRCAACIWTIWRR
ncbi:hypothetical protein [Rhodanobacter lindaniclasticus]